MNTRVGLFVLACGVTLLPIAAHAATHHVPADFISIQAAVDGADDGDLIFVESGRFCGARIDKEVHLVGYGATIVGCEELTVYRGLRVGFFLTGVGASGTSITHFHFDGVGISQKNLGPLAFAVFARESHSVVIDSNRVEGTVQAITNTNGDDWTIQNNLIDHVTAFSCPGLCGGGSAIVIQNRQGTSRSSIGNRILDNRVRVRVPTKLRTFTPSGITIIAQDEPTVAGNRVAVKRSNGALGHGSGIHIARTCCGAATYESSTDVVVSENDLRNASSGVAIQPGAVRSSHPDGTYIQGNTGHTVQRPAAKARP